MLIPTTAPSSPACRTTRRLGGYTTFSSFSLEILTLIRNNQWMLAIVYALGSVLTGLLAVWAGTIVARWF